MNLYVKELFASLKEKGYELSRKTNKALIFEKSSDFDPVEDDLTRNELDDIEPVLKSYSDRRERHVRIQLYLRKLEGKPILTLYLLHRKEAERISAFTELAKILSN